MYCESRYLRLTKSVLAGRATRNILTHANPPAPGPQPDGPDGPTRTTRNPSEKRACAWARRGARALEGSELAAPRAAAAPGPGPRPRAATDLHCTQTQLRTQSVRGGQPAATQRGTRARAQGFSGLGGRPRPSGPQGRAKTPKNAA